MVAGCRYTTGVPAGEYSTNLADGFWRYSCSRVIVLNCLLAQAITLSRTFSKTDTFLPSALGQRRYQKLSAVFVAVLAVGRGVPSLPWYFCRSLPAASFCFLGSILFGCPFSLKKKEKKVVYGHCLVTLPTQLMKY